MTVPTPPTPTATCADCGATGSITSDPEGGPFFCCPNCGPFAPAAPTPPGDAAETYVPTEEQCREAAEARGEDYRAAPEENATPATCDYCRGVGACPRCWGRAAIEELKAKLARSSTSPRPAREEVERAAHAVFMEGYHEGRGEGAAGEDEVVASLTALLGYGPAKDGR